MNNRQQISINSLDFDQQNPRLTKDSTTQEMAIQGILENEATSCIELLQDLVEYGISPNDIPIALESDNNRYVVLEGNRRLLALKLLAGDAVVLKQLNDKQRKKVQKITESATPITEIEVVVAQDREEADHWIKLKHSRGNNGAATQPWKPFEKDRHDYTKDASRCTPALALFYYAQQLAKEDHSLDGHVHRIHNSHYSTLQRIANSSHFGRLTGITFEGTRIQATNGHNHLKSIVTELFSTIGAQGANSRALNKDAEIKAFLTTLSEKHAQNATEEAVSLDIDIPISQTPQDTGSAGKPVQEDIPEITQVVQANASTTVKKPTPKKPLEGLYFSSIGEPEKNLLDEVKRLSFNGSPHLVAAAFRILLDLATQRFEKDLKHFSFAGKPDLDGRVCQIIDHIEPEFNDPFGKVQGWPTLKAYRAQMATKPLKPLQLGVHGTNTTVLPNTVEKLEPLVRAILVAIDEKLGKDDRL